MIAKLAYLTSPAPDRYVLHVQAEDPVGTFNMEIEISRAHLANIIIDGASMSLREQYPHRVPVEIQTVSANEREYRR